MPEHAPQPAQRQAQQRLAQQMGQIGFTLPGSVVVRHTRCGKTSCRCKANPPQLHGPYNQWTRKISGKTVTRLLTSDQLQRYQPWFDNARRLRDSSPNSKTSHCAPLNTPKAGPQSPKPHHTSRLRPRKVDPPRCRTSFCDNLRRPAILLTGSGATRSHPHAVDPLRRGFGSGYQSCTSPSGRRNSGSARGW